jgi:hypothetical protein
VGTGKRGGVLLVIPDESAMMQLLLEIIRRNKPWLLAAALLAVANIIFPAATAIYQAPALQKQREAWKRLSSTSRNDPGEAYRTGKKDLEKLQTMIPSRRRFPYVLGELLDAAASCSVIPGDLKYKSKVVKDRKLLAYEVTMPVTGQYGAIKLFLSELQAKEGLMVIDDIKLSNDDPYVEKVTMEVKLTVYLKDDA